MHFRESLILMEVRSIVMLFARKFKTYDYECSRWLDLLLLGNPLCDVQQMRA